MKYLLATAFALLSWCPAFAQDEDIDRDALYAEFVALVEETVEDLDPTFLNEAMNVNSVGARALKDLDVPSSVRISFSFGLPAACGVGTHLTVALGARGGSYTFLRMRERDGVSYALFRSLIARSLNYHEYELSLNEDGEVQVDDVFLFASGEHLSGSMRRNCLRMAAGEEIADGDEESDLVRNLRLAAEFMELVGDGDFEEALEAFDDFPAELREDRKLLLTRLMISGKVSEGAYVRASTEFQEIYPDDEFYHLALCDVLLERREFDLLLENVEVLQGMVGGDPYLDCIAALAHYGGGDVQAAVELAKAACEEEPSLDALWRTVATFGCNESEFSLVVWALDGLGEHCDYAPDDLVDEPQFEEFFSSADGAKWLASYEGSAPKVSAEDAEEAFFEFAVEVEETMAMLDSSVLDEALDFGAMGRRITNKVPGHPGQRREFLAGMGPSIRAIGAEIVAGLEIDGAFSFLGLRERDGKPHLQFRVLIEGGLNYYELEVELDSAGDVRIVDIYIFLLGEHLSSMARRLYMQMVAAESPDAVEADGEAGSDLVEYIDEIRHFQGLCEGGEVDEALALFETLPKSLREERFMQSQRATVAQLAADDVYMEVLNAYAKLFPGDENLCLWMMDAYILVGDFEKALAAIDDVENLVVGDDYLDCLRASVLLEMGKVEEAIAKARSACEAIPQLEDAWWILAGIGLGSEEFEVVVEGLEGLMDHHFYLFYAEDLEGVPEYEAFLASEVGQAWAERQAELEEESEDY
jgi:tetratricopeptide (TPR) repeat protein